MATDTAGATYIREATNHLKALVPVWQQYQTATNTADDAYKALTNTPDGHWRAALLALATARQAALTAAKNLDDAAYPIAELTEATPIRVLEQVPYVREIASQAGIDTTGWNFLDRDVFEYRGASPAVDRLKETYAAQDEQIRSVNRLAGDKEPSRL